MKKFIISSFLIMACFSLQAVTYDMIWTGNAGSTATATIVIDETVCLNAGSCGSLNQPAATVGVTSFTLTIVGGCAASTYPLADIDLDWY